MLYIVMTKSHYLNHFIVIMKILNWTLIFVEVMNHYHFHSCVKGDKGNLAEICE